MSEEEKRYNSLLHSGMFWEFHPELTGKWEEDKYYKYGIDGQYITFPPNFKFLLLNGDVIYQGDTYIIKQDGKFRLFDMEPDRFVSLEMLLKPWRKL